MGNENSNMKTIRRWVLWMTLGIIVLLLVLSVIGSFRGADKASELFNSDPLVVFWVSLTGLLVLGILFFPRLLRKPGLLAIHLGSILILLGAMWSSEQGHELLEKDKIPNGYLAIFEGESDDTLRDQTLQEELGKIPFALRTEDFWIDYHWDPGKLHIRYDSSLANKPSAHGQTNPHMRREETSEVDSNISEDDSNRIVRMWQIPAKVGEELNLDPNKLENASQISAQENEKSIPLPLKYVKVKRVIQNLKVAGRITDRPRDEPNPALLVELMWTDGKNEAPYVFPPGAPYTTRIRGFEFVYEVGPQVGIKDYYSDLVVLDAKNHVQQRKVIEVNKPLHYGGYHFYQTSYGHSVIRTARGPQSQWYTVLHVVSDSGVPVVFLGYWLLCLGVFWQCWLQHIIRYLGKRS
jgi:ResB-like family